MPSGSARATVRSTAALFERDPLSRVHVHGRALTASRFAWRDAVRLHAHPLTRRMASQLYEAVGSIGANLAEGYSRGYVADRARFLEYAVGSAREAREWYVRGGGVLGREVVHERVRRLNIVIALLTVQLRALASLRRGRRPFSMTFHGARGSAAPAKPLASSTE